MDDFITRTILGSKAYLLFLWEESGVIVFEIQLLTLLKTRRALPKNFFWAFCGLCTMKYLRNKNQQDSIFFLNPSAWGHLNPSSYCDVGRLFYGVFKLWSKLQRKK
jgi:hypothetical protein